MPRKSYAELEEEVRKLRNKLAHMEARDERIDRYETRYGLDTWFAIPLPHCQKMAITDVITNRVAKMYGEGRQIRDGVYEIIIDDAELLPGVRAYAVHCEFDDDGTLNGICGIWRLIPE